MKNYIKITNFSEFPNIKGLHVSEGNLVRTFCSCGYVECSIVKTCPDCGNTEFVSNKQKIVVNQLVKAASNSYEDPLALYESSSYCTIARNQTPTTKIIMSKAGNYTTLMANISNSNIVKYFDCPEFLAHTEYVVAKEMFLKYNDKMQWSNMLRFVLKVKRDCGSAFCMEKVQEVIDYFGENNLATKLQHLTTSYKSLTIPDMTKLIETMHPTMRAICDYSSPFQYFVCNGHANEGNCLPTELLDFLYAYMAGRYLAQNQIDRIICTLYDKKIEYHHVDPIIKFIKECYADINSNTWCLIPFIDFINIHGFTSVKDYFLHRNALYLTRSYKKNIVDEAMLDVYTNPAQALINIANS